MADWTEEQLQALEPESLARRNFLKMAATVGGGALVTHSLGGFLAQADAAAGKAPTSASPAPAITQVPDPTPPAPLSVIEARNFDANLSTVEGLSQNQLKQHLGLYQNYVKKINEIQSALRTYQPDVAKANATYDPFRELHVEQTFALNGVVLHELYFENLGGTRMAPSESLKDAFSRAFGSWADYTTHLKALGKSMRGWAITALNLRDGQIHHYGLDSHNQLVPIHVVPLLVLDVFEHAYMIDFGTNRGAYLDAFLANVNWEPVEKRLEAARRHPQLASR
jgi:Fe-Mn family superoxide dismutase